MHGNGFTEQERTQFKKGIIKNILTAVLATVVVVRDGGSTMGLNEDDFGSNYTGISRVTSESSTGDARELSIVKVRL